LCSSVDISADQFRLIHQWCSSNRLESNDPA
jgi:hypothetical protein